MMLQKPRGATPLHRRHGTFVPRRHLWALVAVSATLAVAIGIMPSGRVEANKQDTVAVTQTASENRPALVPVKLSGRQKLPPLNLSQWHEYTVRPGDNLSLIFGRAGFTDRDVYRIVHKAQGGRALTRIYPGQSIAFLSGPDGGLQAVRYRKSPLESAVFSIHDGRIDTRQDIRTPETRTTWATATIESSLFLAGQQAGLSQALIMEVAGIFGGVVDFVLDPRQGDTLHVLYEQLYLDGERLGDGNILAASFTNSGRTLNAFRYTDATGRPNYYNEDGISMRKAFLRAPVDFTRISSNFNPERLHPIYKTRRPHRGTDYAAPPGTPVYAAGDGRVIEAGYTSANGNYVFLQHGERYVTRYLHLTRFNVKKGERVTQNEIIGTVGSTGAATGPHLHYEFLIDGVHHNPRTVHKSLPKARSLPAAELASFKQETANYSMQLAALQSGGQLAMGASESSENGQ